MHRHGRESSGTGGSGFTLIEVMVVIAIIAALAATGTLMIQYAQKRQRKFKTEATLNALMAALEQIDDANQLGYYPPTETSALVAPGGVKLGQQLGAGNEYNVGIETLFVVFRMKGITARPQGVDDAIGNTDSDSGATAVGDMQKPDLLEYLDAWGNPIVYFHNRDYKTSKKVAQYMLGDKKVVTVEPKKNATTGEYKRADSYQLFSLGQDGLPDTDDDVDLLQ